MAKQKALQSSTYSQHLLTEATASSYSFAFIFWGSSVFQPHTLAHIDLNKSKTDERTIDADYLI